MRAVPCFIFIKLYSILESKLHKSGVIDNQTPYFPGAPNRPLFVEDDHIPFLEKGECCEDGYANFVHKLCVCQLCRNYD